MGLLNMGGGDYENGSCYITSTFRCWRSMEDLRLRLRLPAAWEMMVVTSTTPCTLHMSSLHSCCGSPSHGSHSYTVEWRGHMMLDDACEANACNQLEPGGTHTQPLHTRTHQTHNQPTAWIAGYCTF